MASTPKIKIGIAQTAPVWLNKEKTIAKAVDYIEEAARNACDLLVFGEGFLPGYPFWLSITNGAAFDHKIQKEIYAHYVKNAVIIEEGDLVEICAKSKKHKIAIYLGCIEKAADRGGHSLYCTLVFIDANGAIKSAHRKLQPTYEERLVWAQGDGNGLQVHPLKGFTLGGLNCWENWMPLARTALYGQGENLHVAVWPGSERNTQDITRFIAKESRSFVISASSLMRKSDISREIPHYNVMIENAPDILANGGSCIATPNGEWVIPPVVDKEGLISTEIDLQHVLEERQNFDSVGHYSRPDVTQLSVNRARQSIVKFY